MRDPDLGEHGGSVVTLTVFDEAQERVAAYVLTDAWPRRLDIGAYRCTTVLTNADARLRGSCPADPLS